MNIKTTDNHEGIKEYNTYALCLLLYDKINNTLKDISFLINIDISNLNMESLHKNKGYILKYIIYNMNKMFQNNTYRIKAIKPTESTESTSIEGVNEDLIINENCEIVDIIGILNMNDSDNIMEVDSSEPEWGDEYINPLFYDKGC